MKNNQVSVVIPAYNVEKYIDKCIESVCNQTYKELEILIVADEGSDRTVELCHEWGEKDSRIRVIDNKRRIGLGAARNLGTRLASGKYVMYLDSDDWYADYCVETLLKIIISNKTPIAAYSDIYFVRNDRIIRNGLIRGGKFGSSKKAELLVKGYPAVWNRIYDRKWLIENDLLEPEIYHYEDWGYSIPLLLSEYDIYIAEGAGVFYREQRSGKLSSDGIYEICKDFRRTLEYGLDRTSKEQIARSQNGLSYYLSRDYFMRKRQAREANAEEAIEVLDTTMAEIKRRYDVGYTLKERRVMVLGSFSLRWELQRSIIIRDEMNYYGFSGLIAAMASGEEKLIKHENPFRAEQIEKDFTGRFIKTLRDAQDTVCLFLDFMNSQYDIVRTWDGNYYTKSEAFDQVDEDIEAGEIISPQSDRYEDLFINKSLELLDIIRKSNGRIEVCVIKNRFAEVYGGFKHTEYYPDREAIQNRNRIVEKYEMIFLNLCHEKNIGIKIYDLPKESVFTDEYFRLGCEPQYLNESLYTDIGYQIFKDNR